ncbi:hypothetical protein LJ707_12675 [Mucilaginibacter sp. UR6-1]|uniref:hypothetical protein n=1 Tax=Mucilaginibacter sp. UR6-1 TaxID=1435643 RepID=UPI001E54F5B5|nr:hypothetical protein [Mucilaginibacter sp. UR6-1]MCC8409786.1 hypothetical protein [Mucilaginibacter sp. UR6-1]
MLDSNNKSGMGRPGQDNSLNEESKKTLELLDEVRQRINELTVIMKQGVKSFDDFTDRVAAAEVSLKKANSQMAENSKVLNSNSNLIKQNKELLESIKEEYDELSKTQGSNISQVNNLNVQIVNLNKTIDNQEKKVAKSREAFDYQKHSLDALKSSFDQIKASVEKSELFDEKQKSVLDDAAKGFNAMKTGLGAVKTGFQSVGGAIKTTGFGLLVLVLQSLVEYFTESSQGVAMLKVALNAVGKVVDGVKGVFMSFGKAIVDAVMNPAETVKKVWNAVLDNIGNRFKGVSVFFDGLFKGDIKKMGDGLIQMGTGITNGTDKIKNGLNTVKEFAEKTGKEFKKAYEDNKKDSDSAADNEVKNTSTIVKTLDSRLKKHKQFVKDKNKIDKDSNKEAEEEELASIARLTALTLSGYAKEVKETNDHFDALVKKHVGHKKTIEQLEKERAAVLAGITTRYQNEELLKLEDYQRQIERLQVENITDARERAIKLIELESKEELAAYQKKHDELEKQIKSNLKNRGRLKSTDITKIAELTESIEQEQKLLAGMEKWKEQYEIRQTQKKNEINANSQQNNAQPETPTGQYANGAENSEIIQLQKRLDVIKVAEQLAGIQSVDMQQKFAKQKFDIEMQLTQSRMLLGDKFLDNVLKNSKKDSAIFKAAFIAKKATAVGDIIISTRKAIMESLQAYSGIPFIGQALGIAQAAFMAAQGATSIADIVKQKPGYARGGRFMSDGRGALLGGYSRTDDTNAYLRSGEAVVVSEAMRNPWARNLVSAINVAYGGRDFSTGNTSPAYALGGVYTDGGNAGRYYSQPVNDVKEMANTLAYQIINNFPPVYVDVKDINTQQSILARTVDRVNL